MSSQDILDEVVPPYVFDAPAFVKKTPLFKPCSRHESMLHAIANGTHVKNALAILPLARTLGNEVNYGPTVRLLNCVSYGYYQHVFGQRHGQVIIFGSMTNTTPRSDCLSLDFEPDYSVFVNDVEAPHSQLCELGVLHRDVSWFKVMCNPKHLIKLHPLLKSYEVLSRLCSNRIIGVGNPERCVLLADLDHAVKLGDTVVREPGEKTGTPMFISAELSKPDSLNLENQDLDWIMEDLRKAEQYPEEFARAFPGGDGGFLRNFEKVISGARPLDSSPIEPRLSRLAHFCSTMFQHSIDGRTDEVGRGGFLTSPCQLGNLFHPRLKPFERLVTRMARYLGIPWYLYGDGGESPRNILKPDRVHIAFHRFALAFLLDPANQDALSIALDTQVPCYCYTDIVDDSNCVRSQ